MTTIGTLYKYTRKEIRFTLKAINDQKYISARAWHLGSTGQYYPSESDITFQPDLLGELLNALRDARKAVLQ